MGRYFRVVTISGLIGAVAYLSLSYLNHQVIFNQGYAKWQFALLNASYPSVLSLLLFFTVLSTKRLLITVGVLAAVSFTLFWSIQSRYDGSEFGQSLVIILPQYVLSLGIIYLLPFIESLWKNGFKLDYPTIFATTWFMFISMVIASAYGLIGFSVEFISLYVLDKVGFGLLNSAVGILTLTSTISGLLFGVSIGIAHMEPKIVSTLRRLLSILALILLPILFFVSTIIALRLPFANMRPSSTVATYIQFSDTATFILLTLVTVCTLTVWADRRLIFGEAEEPKIARAITVMARLFCLILVVFGIYIFWGISTRIIDYGFTPWRIYALIFCIVAGVYAFGYGLISIWPKSNWSTGIKKVNVVAAIVFIVMSLLSATPIMDPTRISAHSQYARFEKGVPIEELGIDEMKETWGYAGQEMANKLIAADEARNKDSLEMNSSQDGEPQDYDAEEAAKILRELLSESEK